jgi:hypothetical protein
MTCKYKQFKKGIYRPVNEHKYVGTSLPTYRSSYELKFFRWCDMNPKVFKWGSESIAIPYQSPVDGRVHHYYPDNIIKIKEGDKISTYLVEIKPLAQVKPPEPSNRKSQKRVIFEQVQWAVNTAKWKAAKQWCDNVGFKFQIITEQELKID